MNDEETLAIQSTDQDRAPAETGDPLPAALPLADRERGGCDTSLPDDAENGAADPLSVDPVQDADPPASPPAPSPDPSDTGERLEQLRGEISKLREELAKRDARLSEMGEEYAEFAILYPNVPLSALDESVMEDVRRGIPIAAAYALSEKRRTHAAEAAARINADNQRRSAGTVKPTSGEYFTPEEVRRMSREEVRTHYSKIIASMQKWH